jgi:hypothetical protein
VVAGLNKKLASGSEATQGGLRIIQSVNSTPNKYNLGITLTSYQNTDWISGNSITGDLDFNTTYLVVIKYTIGAGTDSIKMWLNPNPTVTTTEGQGAAQTLTYTPTANDVSLKAGDVIDGLVLAQQYFAGNFTAEVDEVRIGTSYSDVLTNAGPTPPAVNAVKNWEMFQ